MKLNFNETNILTQVLIDRHILSNPSKENIIQYLTELEGHTDETVLVQSVSSLRYKIMQINQNQLNQIYNDLVNDRVSATQAYVLPE